MPRVFYIHIPKAGGTSIWNMLSQHYTPGQSLSLPMLDSLTDPRSLCHVDPVGWNLEADAYAAGLSPNITYVQGHFPSTRFMGRVDGFFFTWLRHPYLRALSHYFYWRQIPSVGHHIHDYVKSNNLPFDRFIELPMIQNMVTKLFFPGDTFYKLDFFGFQETFDEDWQTLCHSLGIVPMETKSLNQTDYPKEYLNILHDDKIFKRFCELNKDDMDLFWFAKNLKDQRFKPLK
jgi:hypothetical protein